MKLALHILIAWMSIVVSFGSIEFNGTTQYATSDSSIDLTASPKCAVAFWLYVPSYSNSNGRALEFGTNRTTISGSFTVVPDAGDGLFDILVHGDVGDNTVTFTRPSAATWHHFVINMDFSVGGGGKEVPSVYVDGSLVSTGTGTISDNTGNFNNKVLYVGARNGTTLFQNMRIEGLTLWGGLNLSAGNASAVFGTRNNSTVLGVQTSSIKFSWTLQGITGAWTGAGSISDQSGHSVTGTPFNSPTGLATTIFIGPQTIYAADVSLASVQAAINSAITGDTVVMPAGSASWTNQLFMNNGVSLIGAGTNLTIITDAKADRQTGLISVGLTFSNFIELSNFKMDGGSQISDDRASLIVIGGSFKAWRIHHLWMVRPRGRPIAFYCSGGLVDHVYFDQTLGSSGLVFNGVNLGDEEWSQAWLPGTTNSGVYIEDCLATNTLARAITDGFAGAKYVIRHCTLGNLNVQVHGTESAQRKRSARAVESYENTFLGNVGGEYAHHTRGGTLLCFSNSVNGTSYPGLWRGLNERTTDAFPPWQQANGTNVWDLNDATLYVSGTHTGGNGTRTLTSSVTLTNSGLVGFSLINTSSGASGQILANTTTQVTTVDQTTPGTFWEIFWNTGNTFQVRKVLRVLDGVGNGIGDAISGGSDSVNPTPTGWTHEANEPVHIWANTGTVTALSGSGNYTVVAGRDYTNVVLAGYSPLIYPHPLTTNAAPPVPTVVISGYSPVKNIRRMLR